MNAIQRGLILFALFTLTTACGRTDFSAGEEALLNVKAEDQELPLSEVDDRPDLLQKYSCGVNKVIVCHVPPGNPSEKHTICIGEPAWQAHLSHEADNGEKDYLGPCKL